jgi:hypothetical protein
VGTHPVDKLSTSWEQAVRTHPVDKLLEQHCYKSAAGLLQLVGFYVTVQLALPSKQEYFYNSQSKKVIYDS